MVSTLHTIVENRELHTQEDKKLSNWPEVTKVSFENRNVSAGVLQYAVKCDRVAGFDMSASSRYSRSGG